MFFRLDHLQAWLSIVQPSLEVKLDPDNLVNPGLVGLLSLFLLLLYIAISIEYNIYV